MSRPFRNGEQIEAFVKAAVQLPRDRLRRIDRGWEKMHPQRAVVSELVLASTGVREEMIALRKYIAEVARGADLSPDTVAEEVAEAIMPAARALLLREVLEEPGNPRRAAAFSVLTEPFQDILPRR